jgi:hypothetical protein
MSKDPQKSNELNESKKVKMSIALNIAGNE